MSQALNDAINAQDIDHLAKLLAAGEDPNAPLGPQNTYPPLQGAVGYLEATPTRPGLSIDGVVLLLRYGADPNACDLARTDFPILDAVERRQIEAVRLLLAAGADPNVKNIEGISPLYYCVQNKLYEMARLLLRCGATKTMDKWQDAGLNALGLAAWRLDLEMVKLLLEYGADPNARDLDDATPLYHFSHHPVPDDPIAQERFREICHLLGGELVPDEP